MSRAGIANGFRKVTHCIFDMDGLLLDTEKLYTQASQIILDEFGKTYTMDVKAKVMGLHTYEVSKIMVDSFALPISYEEYGKRQREITERIMVEAELMPGAERLIRHLHANKVAFALATSSGEEMVQIKITKHRELFSLFNHHVCGSTDPEVKEGKPSPDVFLVAAKRFADKPDPSVCLVFEDAPNGVKAAISAGMRVIIVPDPKTPPESYTLATKVLKSLNDFRPEEFGLPAFQDS